MNEELKKPRMNEEMKKWRSEELKNKEVKMNRRNEARMN